MLPVVQNDPGIVEICSQIIKMGQVSVQLMRHDYPTGKGERGYIRVYIYTCVHPI